MFQTIDPIAQGLLTILRATSPTADHVVKSVGLRLKYDPTITARLRIRLVMNCLFVSLSLMLSFRFISVFLRSCFKFLSLSLMLSFVFIFVFLRSCFRFLFYIVIIHENSVKLSVDFVICWAVRPKGWLVGDHMKKLAVCCWVDRVFVLIVTTSVISCESLCVIFRAPSPTTTKNQTI